MKSQNLSLIADLSQPRRITVTGGAGFLGNHIVRRLVANNHTVQVIDDLSVGGSLAGDVSNSANVSFAQVDISEYKKTRSYIRDFEPDLIIHLAAIHFIPTCIANPRRTLEVNVVGTQNVLDACGELSAPPGFVLASTADVYSPDLAPHSETSVVAPDNVYGLSKWTAEGLTEIARRQGICRTLRCRLFNLFGPGETNPHVLPEIIKQLRASNTLRLGNISPKRDFVFVVDAAEALISLTEVATSGSVVNVGTGHSYSVEELLANVAQITGLELKIERDPERWRASDRPNLQSDPSALRALLPGALATDLADGLKALIASELDA